MPKGKKVERDVDAFVAELFAQIEGTQRCITVVIESLARHDPTIRKTIATGFDLFAEGAARDGEHPTQIALFRMMAEGVRAGPDNAPATAPTDQPASPSRPSPTKRH